MAHLEDAERVLQYLRGTYDQGISFYDLGPDKRKKLGGWVDSDFATIQWQNHLIQASYTSSLRPHTLVA
jgi:hypothetical protein